MRFLTGFILFAALLPVIQGCSIYQSGGREAIEKDAGKIVTKAGFTESFTHYYECEGTHKRPDFLDKPNEVLVTPFEAADYTVLTSQTDPLKWITVFRYLEDNKAYYFCKIQSADGHKYGKNELFESAYVGVTEIELLMQKAGQ